MLSSAFRLHKSRKIYRSAYRFYLKKRAKLNELHRTELEQKLAALQQAIQNRDPNQATEQAQHLDQFLRSYHPKTVLNQAKELLFALIFAIIVAFIIRQVWFELYEVPTGSMRPTIEELDRLVVSKTTFGINLPFRDDLLFLSQNMCVEEESLSLRY